MTPPCKIEWITIPSPNLEIAKSFYSNVFGFEITEHSDRFWIFKAANLSGGLDADQLTSPQGIGFSITVDDMKTVILAIKQHGGEITKSPYSLGQNAGYCAAFLDPNGNAIELFSMNSSKG